MIVPPQSIKRYIVTFTIIALAVGIVGTFGGFQILRAVESQLIESHIRSAQREANLVAQLADRQTSLGQSSAETLTYVSTLLPAPPTRRDNGPGIPAELGARIFDSFVTTKSATEGTGLGLSRCRRFIEAHHGTIALVPSTSGTAFEIILPTAVVPSCAPGSSAE